MKLVAIHQPNFFPWLGFFDKIRRADVFVILDNVQFQKTGGTWSNRVMLNIGGQGRWVTAPVVRNFHGVRMINEIAFNNAEPWRDRIVKTLSAHYRPAPAFSESMRFLQPLLSDPQPLLCRYNLDAICAIAELLGLDTGKFVLASSLKTSGKATELLVKIVHAVGGSHYLAGGGAQGYQQDDLFSAAGVGLVHQSFAHPVYRQTGGAQFIPGLSVIDALMNCGIEETASLVGRRNG